MKDLLPSDLPFPKKADDLIGRVIPCPHPNCGTMLDIGSGGVEHFGHRHIFKMSLEELFQMTLWGNKIDRLLWFGNKTQSHNNT
jgi:hypothetical protein